MSCEDDFPLDMIGALRGHDRGVVVCSANHRFVRGTTHDDSRHNSTDLNEYFTQFAWYMPDPNLRMEEIRLTEKESEFLAKIIIEEKK